MLLLGAFTCLAAPADPPAGNDYALLSQRELTLPIRGLRVRDIQDTFTQARDGGKRHEATDILAPRGTPVVAVEDGIIQKLFLSKPGGITVYEFDRAGVFCYYYAHLERYAPGLTEGMTVNRGDTIGYVELPAMRRPKHLTCTLRYSGWVLKNTGGKEPRLIPTRC